MAQERLTARDPSRIGAYHLWRRLGAGAQGVVYEAYPASGTPVALKVLRADGVTPPPRREVEAASRIGGPWVAKVLAFDLAGSPAYIASELIAGPSLAEAVARDGVLTGAHLEGVASAVASALAAIHGAGVVHRDLKPENVIIGPDGPRVVDFGLARMVDHQQTDGHGQPGTLAYLAPELLTPGQGRQGPAADVFAWGALVLFAATGRHVFDRDRPAAIIDALRSHNPDLSALPASLRPWVESALAKSPRDRPTSALLMNTLQGAGPYADSGGWTAPPATADRVYDALSPGQQDALPAILLRMVTPTWVPSGRAGGGDLDYGTASVTRQDFDGTVGLDALALDDLLRHMSDEGLVVGGPTMRINSAVLATWPRLRAWLHDEGLDLLEFNTIRLAAHAWQGGAQPRELLNREELHAATRWTAARHHTALNDTERHFLLMSGRARIRAARRNRTIVAALALLLVAALGAAGLAAQRQRDTDRQRDLAAAREFHALSRLHRSDPALSGGVAVAAWQLDPSPESRAQLLDVLATPARAVLAGHTGAVVSVAGSPDGRLLATGGEDGTVRFWDLATRRQVGAPLTVTGRMIDEEMGSVKAVAFSPDGRMLVTGGGDGAVRVYDVSTRRRIGEPLFVPLNDSDFAVVSDLALSPDGSTVATGIRYSTDARLWDLRTGRQIGAPLSGGDDAPVSLAFSPDGTRLASCGEGSAYVWKVRSRERVKVGDDGCLAAVFSPDGDALATADSDKKTRLWDVRTRTRIGEPMAGHTGKVVALAFSPDGQVLATSGDDGTARLWDVRTQSQVGDPLTGHTGTVQALTFIADGGMLATGSDDGTARLWDVRTHRQIGGPFTGHTGPVLAVRFGPGGRTLRSGGSDRTARVWDRPTYRQVSSHRIIGLPDRVDVMDLDAGGRLMAASARGTTVLWDMTAHERVGPLRENGFDTGEIYGMAFSPDSTMLALGRVDHAVLLWDTRTLRRSGPPLTGHGDVVTALAFSPDGMTLAGGGSDATVRLWDVRARKQVGNPLPYGPGSAVTFSPDGQILAIGADYGAVRLWDVRTGREKGSALTGHRDSVLSLAFSPDGSLLASGSADGTVRLWDVEARRQIGTPFTDHGEMVLSLEFSPDGTVLASAGREGTVRLWEVSIPSHPDRAVCAASARPLTREEWSRLLPGGPAYRRVCARG
ncbi:WD40 repeat domain-containing serine/threonine protein kinase [Nonomuraea jiangxiensis]|uniref:WD40 repeat n=1 Tax=Nonomuraea jiangxiensis TaxID=633440 RepID=A0A1G8SBS9_9ACTN|nr:protein kinase [Nonomuraea jiangxiensis]SDJ26667.1 WD40 repeat [Nonomuraea jiangxiensis]